MGKIVAVSVMSAIVSVSFNGCGFFKSTGNQALASLSNVAGQSVSNALSSKSSSGKSQAKSANDENDKGKCSSNEIKTDKSVEKGECKGGKRNGVWKYYDNYGYIQKEITFQNGEMTIEKVYDKDENLSYMAKYNKDEEKGEEYKRRYGKKGELVSFEHFKTDSKVKFERKYEIKKLIQEINDKTLNLKEQAQEIAQKRAESKVKKPTMQEVRNSKNAMDTYRANLQAQVEKELQIELNGKVPSIPNFDAYSDAQLIAYINSNKLEPQQEQVYSVEPITDGSLRLTTEGVSWYFERYNEFKYGSSGSWEKMGEIYSNRSSCTVSYGNVEYKERYNCRTFATQYKHLIDKSAFKDTIYNLLPKPKNQ